MLGIVFRRQTVDFGQRHEHSLPKTESFLALASAYRSTQVASNQASAARHEPEDREDANRERERSVHEYDTELARQETGSVVIELELDRLLLAEQKYYQIDGALLTISRGQLESSQRAP